MNTQLKAWGNSKAVRIPSKALQLSGVSENDDLEVFVEDGEIILSKEGHHEASIRRALAYRDGFSGLSDVVIAADVRKEAEDVCEQIGLSLQTAIGIFLQKVGRERRIPFELVASDEVRGRQGKRSIAVRCIQRSFLIFSVRERILDLIQSRRILWMIFVA